MIIINNSNSNTYPCLNERMYPTTNAWRGQLSQQLFIVVLGCQSMIDTKINHHNKRQNLFYLDMVILTQGADISSTVLSKIAISLGKLSILWLLGFIFCFLFEHLSSPGSPPSPLNHLTSNCTTVPICERSHSQETRGALRRSSSPWTSALSHPLCSNFDIITCTMFPKR